MKTYRILIVEDEQITALDLSGTLQELGHEVVGMTARAEKSIELAMDLKPELVLMDIHLADDMLGTEAAEIIHQQLNLPVIFLTAYTDARTMEDALVSLPYGYLVKPYERRDIEAGIRVAMNRFEADEDVRIVSERLQLALKAARMKMWEWQPDNPQALADPEEPPRLARLESSLDDLLERLNPEDVEQVKNRLTESSRIICEVRVDDGNGERWHRLFATVTLGPYQQRQVTGLLQDIDEEHAMQASLLEADMLFRTSSEGMVITDADFCVTRVNPAFLNISGYDQQELIGTNPETLLFARRSDDNPMRMATATESWSGEVVCKRKCGEIFPAWEHIGKLRDDQGRHTGYIINLSDISRLRRAEQNLTQMAYVDSLTGLGNRVRFEKCLTEALAERPQGASIGLAYIDLDGFKLVNDTMGHAEGDKLLKVLAERLVESLRDDDTVARLGGDEFVVLVPRVYDETTMKVVASKIMDVCSMPVKLSREQVQLSASIGVVESDDSSSELDDLLRAADAAMFEAKKLGKNQVCFYDFALEQEYRQRIRIEADLRQAIERNEFILGFQPLFNASDGSLCGAEALLRWQHSSLGLLAPAHFIPIAEQSDAIVSIGRWVLDESCRTASEWRQIGLGDCRIAVNISARQMSDERFPGYVEEVLSRYDLPPDLLELEMTETALQSSEPLVPQLNRIRQLGVHLAIDDFGTGYSSLGRLKDLPFDRVKIDKSFVRDLPDDLNNIEICKAIVAMCRVLNLSVTAEGVETPQQEALLRQLGCDCLQGFLYSAAVPADRLASTGNH